MYQDKLITIRHFKEYKNLKSNVVIFQNQLNLHLPNVQLSIYDKYSQNKNLNSNFFKDCYGLFSKINSNKSNKSNLDISSKSLNNFKFKEFEKFETQSLNLKKVKYN
jgi:hypothetical protein